MKHKSQTLNYLNTLQKQHLLLRARREGDFNRITVVSVQKTFQLIWVLYCSIALLPVTYWSKYWSESQNAKNLFLSASRDQVQSYQATWVLESYRWKRHRNLFYSFLNHPAELFQCLGTWPVFKISREAPSASLQNNHWQPRGTFKMKVQLTILDLRVLDLWILDMGFFFLEGACLYGEIMLEFQGVTKPGKPVMNRWTCLQPYLPRMT